MRIAQCLTTSLFASLVLVPAAQADSCSTEDPAAVAEHIFKMSDTDESGSLSPSEFQAAGLERYSVGFEEFDSNKDGEASIDEYLMLFQRHHAPKQSI